MKIGIEATVVAAALALAGCAHSNDGVDRKERLHAQAILEPKSGSTVGGQAVFLTRGNEVAMELEVTNAPAGIHAVHLHQVGDCSADDASSAGDHWNPASAPHGHLDHGQAHMGDIGNLIVDETGHGTLRMSTAAWSAGSGTNSDVVGRAIVVHAGEDDFQSQPAGNAGGRIACGVIKATGQTPAVVTGALP